jgi:hypothetical protein
MSAVIKNKRSNTAGDIPAPANLEIGELAIYFPDKLIYTKETGGTVIKLGSGVKVYKQHTAPTVADDGDFWIQT